MNYLKRLRGNFLCVLCLLVLSNVGHANWELDSTALSGSCALVSPVVSIDDGQGSDTNIQLKLNKNQLLVTTDSNIDNTLNDLGLKVDNNSFIYITEVVDTTHVSFKQDRIDEILKQFVPGRKVLLHLRFWPTWPTTGIKTAEFSLIGFTKALKSLPQCE